jgi:hypothetical protein
MTKVAAVILLMSGFPLAAWSFREIVRGYRHGAGFPWLPSLGFAAASVAALAALRALLAP